MTFRSVNNVTTTEWLLGPVRLWAERLGVDVVEVNSPVADAVLAHVSHQGWAFALASGVSGRFLVGLAEVFGSGGDICGGGVVAEGESHRA